MAGKLVPVLLFIATLALAAQAGSRYRRDTEDDLNKAGRDLQDGLNNAGNEIDGFFKQIYGGKCLTDDQCLLSDYIAKCDKAQGVTPLDGECRPIWWVWLALGVLALLLLSTCVCCCLCGLCSCILDCLCCCCRNKNSGYSPAGTG